MQIEIRINIHKENFWAGHFMPFHMNCNAIQYILTFSDILLTVSAITITVHIVLLSSYIFPASFACTSFLYTKQDMMYCN